MIMHQSFQYKLDPNQVQEKLLARTSGCARFVWNKGVALNKDLKTKNEPVKNYVAMAKELTSWRAELDWLAETSSCVQQQALRTLEKSRLEALDPKLQRGEPKFKSKWRAKDGFLVPNSQYQLGKLHGHPAVFLPKIGWIRYIESRELEGTPTQVSVTREADGWYISIQAEYEIANEPGSETPLHPNFCSAVGLDLGVVRTATLSDGQHYTCPQENLDKIDQKIERAQKDLSRKKKGSNNYAKNRVELAKLHQKRARVLEDFLHKMTTEITRNHGVIIMEDLSVKSMTRSNKGTIAQPGTDVAKKAHLNRLILGQGWGKLRQLLIYKVKKSGGMLYLVNPAYTSQTCSRCMATDPASRTSQAVFCCTSCNFTANADDNAAAVILNLWTEGHAVSACGTAEVWPQEPRPGQEGSALPDALGIRQLEGGGCQNILL